MYGTVIYIFSMAAYVISAKTKALMISIPILLNWVLDNVRPLGEIAKMNLSSGITAYSSRAQATVKTSLMIVAVRDTLQMTTWSSICKTMIVLSLV